MHIYLAKPGGRKEGPFTLEQVQRDLDAGRIQDNDYWAWHEGLPQWMPLYEVPELSVKGRAIATFPVAPEPEPEPEPELQAESPLELYQEPTTETGTSSEEPVAYELEEPPAAFESETETATELEAQSPESFATEPEQLEQVEQLEQSEQLEQTEQTEELEQSEQTDQFEQLEEPVNASKSEDSSGLPFAALEQIFIFTSGEGRAVFESAIAVQKLQEAVGEDLDAIRGKVFVDVVGRVDVGKDMNEGEIPEKAWRAMSAIRPFMTQRAKDQSYQICIRPFSTETDDSVALMLLYDKKQCAYAMA